MNQDHDKARLLLGAYLLGGLDATDRRTLEAHLPGCQECRDELARSAALPGLLRRLPAGSHTEPADAAVAARPSSSLLPSLLREVDADRARRRRRTVAGVAGLAAAAAMILVVGLQVATNDASDTAGTAKVASVLVLDSPWGLRGAGEAKLVTKPWGTAVTLSASQLPRVGPFTLEVAGTDGRRERAAVWGATSNGVAEVVGATSLRARDIRSVVVIGPDGPVLSTRSR